MPKRTPKRMPKEHVVSKLDEPIDPIVNIRFVETAQEVLETDPLDVPNGFEKAQSSPFHSMSKKE